MSNAPTRTMQSREARYITFDFSTKLAPGDSVAAVVAVEAAAGITVSAPSLVGANVTALLSGPSLAKHLISCRVTTAQGETLELDAVVRVAEGEN